MCSDIIPLILFYLDKEFRNLHPNLSATIENSNFRWAQTLRVAEENGLLYYFLKNLLEEKALELRSDLLTKIMSREERNFERLRKTLDFFCSFFKDENADFVFIKLYRGLPYTPRDVDILVKSEEMLRIKSALKQNGFSVKTYNTVETSCRKEGLLRVDLYQGFYYLSLPFFDEEFLWKDPRKIDICGVKCLIPNREADFLALLIHALLGHRYLSLLDFLYAKSFLKGCGDFNELLHQTRKYGWSRAFLRMIYTLQNIQQMLYSSSDTTKFISFPYLFSPRFIWEAFQGFTNMPVNTKTKFMFISSTLVDKAFFRYQLLQRFIPIEMPDEVKGLIMKSIYKVRHWAGDRKAI